MKNILRTILLIISINLPFSCKTNNDDTSSIHHEISYLKSQIENEIKYIRAFMSSNPNSRVKLYYRKATQIHEHSTKTIDLIEKENSDIEQIRIGIIEYLSYLENEISWSDYNDSYNNIIMYSIDSSSFMNRNDLIRQILLQEYLILDFFTDNFNEGYIPINKFYVAKSEGHNNGIIISGIDSTQLQIVKVKTSTGYDTLNFDYKNGIYLIDFKKYSEIIRGKIQCYDVNSNFIENEFEIRNKQTSHNK